MRDDAVLRRALPLGRGLGRTKQHEDLYKSLPHQNGQHGLQTAAAQTLFLTSLELELNDR